MQRRREGIAQIIGQARRAPDERIAGAVPCVEQIHPTVTGSDEHLWHKARVRRIGEQRFDTIGLRADAVDEAHVSAAAKVIDVVAAFERLVLARGESGWKENTISSLDGHQELADYQSCRPRFVEP